MKKLIISLFVFIVLPSLCSYGNDADRVRSLLMKIRILPFHDEMVDDKAYYDIVSMGKTAVPFLIKSITDETHIDDPRQTPPYKKFTVGDLAIILLCKITGRHFEEQLPSKDQRLFKTEGVNAYFEYVSIPKNRKRLQENWEKLLLSEK